jgi:hypothetical protein
MKKNKIKNKNRIKQKMRSLRLKLRSKKNKQSRNILKKKKIIIKININDVRDEKIRKIAKEESIYFNPNLVGLLNKRYQILVRIRNNKIIQIESETNDNINIRYERLINFINIVINDSRFRIHGDFIFNIADHAEGSDINEIVFSKNKYTQKSLMPDSYAMGNYNNLPDIPDTKPFFKKNKTGYFIGTSTGDSNPELNDRLFYSNYSHHHQTNFRCDINHICQIPIENIKKVYPSYEKFVMNQRKSIGEQRHNYRYIIDIDGNTCSWDRIVWIMKSNCICLKKKSDNINWYYPLFEKNLHYIEFNSPEELQRSIHNLNHLAKKNPQKIRNMIQKSKEFVSTYLSKSAHLTYFGYLLHYISEKYIEV